MHVRKAELAGFEPLHRYIRTARNLSLMFTMSFIPAFMLLM
jgi:hypothetical protein